MGQTFNRTELEAKTKDQLVRMCVDELGIVGITKKPKEDIINGMLALYGASEGTIAKDAKGPVTGIEFTGQSTLTKPGAPFGQRTTTTIHVSCGASSGNFPVEGKTVKEVGDFLREVLNVDRLSTGLVNGKEVGADYILQNGDNLEFLKPAGKKGC
jgi:hypothetical protein